MLDGEKCAQQASGPTLPSNTLPILAPNDPITGTAQILEHLTEFTVFGTYPNPFYDDITIQLFLNEKEDLTFECYDITGKLVYQQEIISLKEGLNYVKLYLNSLNAGNYSLVIKSDHHYSTKKLIKAL